MKFDKIRDEIQQIAANTLAQALLNKVDMIGENRTEQAEKVAETVRVAFETLFKN